MPTGDQVASVGAKGACPVDTGLPSGLQRSHRVSEPHHGLVPHASTKQQDSGQGATSPTVRKARQFVRGVA